MSAYSDLMENPPSALCACGGELLHHDDAPEPFCENGCDGIHVTPDAWDVVNSIGHPLTCRCPHCDTDYIYELWSGK